MTDKAKKAVGVKYIGGGKFLIGVSTSLSFEEWKEMPKKLRDYLVELGIYEVIYD